MARPSQPIFTKEEIEEVIIPMTQPGLRMITQDDERVTLTSEYEHVRALLDADRIVNEIYNLKEAPTYEVELTNIGGYIIKPSRLMQRLGGIWNHLNAILHRGSALKESEPQVRIPAKLEAFYNAYKEFAQSYNFATGQDVEVFFKTFLKDFEQLNSRSFLAFKSAYRSSDTRAKEKKDKTRMYRNRQAICKYIDVIFSIHPEVYLIKLDLGYDARNADVMRQITYLRAKSDFETLMANRHRSHIWKDDLVGFFWKLEEGAERGYHFHLLLFYDATSAEQHQEDKQKLYNRWINEITHGEGACYENHSNSNNSALVPSIEGIVGHNDTIKRKALEVYIDYLLKIDILVGLDTPDHMRVFGRGQVKKNDKEVRSC